MAKKVEVPNFPILDPHLPLPANTGIHEVRNGEGKDILDNTTMRVVELPYRSFHLLWEFAERRAIENYERYRGGPMDNVAQAHLEAVIAFRNTAYDVQLVPVDKDGEAKIRKDGNTLPEGVVCRSCGGNLLIKVTKNRRPMWKCLDCRKRTPRNLPGKPSVEPSKATRAAKSGTDASKPTERPRRRTAAVKKAAKKATSRKRPSKG